MTTTISNQPDVVLVGCSKTKRAERSAARDLYDPSDLFRRRRAYAEQTGKPWAILSALHATIEPDRMIDPYNMTIADRKTAAAGGTKHWARDAIRGAFALAGMTADGRTDRGFAYFPHHLTIEVHAGIDYVRALREVADDYHAGVTIVHPVEGLGIGSQKRWYADRLADASDELETIETASGQLALAL